MFQKTNHSSRKGPGFSVQEARRERTHQHSFVSDSLSLQKELLRILICLLLLKLILNFRNNKHKRPSSYSPLISFPFGHNCFYLVGNTCQKEKKKYFLCTLKDRSTQSLPQSQFRGKLYRLSRDYLAQLIRHKNQQYHPGTQTKVLFVHSFIWVLMKQLLSC